MVAGRLLLLLAAAASRDETAERHRRATAGAAPVGYGRRGHRSHGHRPPAWAAAVPPGACYERVVADWREMVVFARGPAGQCRGASTARAAPVLVALHGYGGGYPDMYVPLVATVVVARGLALAVPKGVNGSWNGHYCCGDALAAGLDDLGALRTLLVAARTKLDIALDLVFALGFSNGGMLAADRVETKRFKIP